MRLRGEPDFSQMDNEGYVVDEIINGALDWRGIDLYPTFRQARAAIAVALSRTKKSPQDFDEGRRDYRIVEAHRLEDGSLERGGTSAIYFYVFNNGRLKKKLLNSGAQ